MLARSNLPAVDVDFFSDFAHPVVVGTQEQQPLGSIEEDEVGLSDGDPQPTTQNHDDGPRVALPPLEMPPQSLLTAFFTDAALEAAYVDFAIPDTLWPVAALFAAITVGNIPTYALHFAAGFPTNEYFAIEFIISCCGIVVTVLHGLAAAFCQRMGLLRGSQAVERWWMAFGSSQRFRSAATPATVRPRMDTNAEPAPTGPSCKARRCCCSGYLAPPLWQHL